MLPRSQLLECRISSLLICYNSSDVEFEQGLLKKKIQEDYRKVQESLAVKAVLLLQGFEDKIDCLQFKEDKKYISREEFSNMMIDLQIEHSFNFELLETNLEVVLFLRRLVGKLCENKEKDSLNMFASKRLDCSKSKILGLNERNQFVWLNFLRAITGVSETKATSLVKKFPSICSLMEAYQQMQGEQEKKLMLKDIEVFSLQGKTSKIGKKLSERIYLFFNKKNPSHALAP